MKPNNLMLQSALNRLQFWHDELLKATNADDVSRIQECARFIEEYGVLIKQMGRPLPGE